MSPDRRGHVLVVDGDSMVRLAIDRQLDVLGWDAYLAGSGADALRLIEQRLDIDLLLIELYLPDVDGQVVARAAKRVSGGLGIVFMCGTPPPAFAKRRAPLLSKPFSTAALGDALKAAIALRDFPADAPAHEDDSYPR